MFPHVKLVPPLPAPSLFLVHMPIHRSSLTHTFTFHHTHGCQCIQLRSTYCTHIVYSPSLSLCEHLWVYMHVEASDSVVDAVQRLLAERQLILNHSTVKGNMCHLKLLQCIYMWLRRARRDSDRRVLDAVANKDKEVHLRKASSCRTDT